ncbi:MAG TPA: glycosyltransferase family 2 protein [Pyrinomonadaceae bacterium]
MPRASIIITTHNRPHTLPRAIASAFAAGADVEVIVVDDASSDETSRICRSIPEIKYVRLDRNQGVAGARNVGLVASSGEFISFLDDDDVRLRHSLDEQIAILQRSPEAMFCYAQAIPDDQSGNQSPPFPAVCSSGDIFWELLARNFIPCGGVVFRRACLTRTGLPDASIPGIDDWDIWIRIAELFPTVCLQAPVMIWRQATPTSAQGSSNTVELISLGAKQFRTRWRKLPRVTAAARQRRQKAWRAFSENVVEHLAWETFRGLCEARPGRALAGARTLLRLHPSALLVLLRRWTRAVTIITLITSNRTAEDLANAKIRLKQIRSDVPRQ